MQLLQSSLQHCTFRFLLNSLMTDGISCQSDSRSCPPAQGLICLWAAPSWLIPDWNLQATWVTPHDYCSHMTAACQTAILITLWPEMGKKETRRCAAIASMLKNTQHLARCDGRQRGLMRVFRQWGKLYIPNMRLHILCPLWRRLSWILTESLAAITLDRPWL